jgi:predicted dehydrogenase
VNVRIGVLGAARINHAALFAPVRRTDRVEVVAIAARNPSRAARVARRRGIPTVHSSYRALLDDPSINAVYIPLPAALHGTWAMAAIAAGKHVLCEKPFTANADEACAVRAAAAGSGLVVMEAHHTSFHPFTVRMRDLVHSGELGDISRASAWFHAPIPPGKDIRWNARLGGGSLMDLGVYPVRLLRDVLGEPTVQSAVALRRGDIDRRMTAHLDIDGVDAIVDCGMWSSRALGAGLEVIGTRARMRVTSPFHPHLGGRIRIDRPGVRRRERADRTSSYRYQLEAFRDEIESGRTNTRSVAEAVATMRVVDDIYRAAGLNPRKPTSPS